MCTGEKVSTFRQRFTTLFEESGKTITELANDLHVSNQTISAWKTGVRSPKEPTIIAIAKYFNVTVEWLMGFDVAKRIIQMRGTFSSQIGAVEQVQEAGSSNLLTQTSRKLRKSKASGFFHVFVKLPKIPPKTAFSSSTTHTTTHKKKPRVSPGRVV